MKKYIVVGLAVLIVIGLAISATSRPIPEVTPDNNPSSDNGTTTVVTETTEPVSTSTSSSTDDMTPLASSTEGSTIEATSTAPITTPSTPVPTTPAPTGFTTMAWIYPSEPGCNAKNEYRDGRKIQVLKPEFFTVNGGALSQFTNSNSACNGYSPAFVADLKKYSDAQYVTVSSASAADMDTFLASALSEDGTEIDTLVSFVVDNNLTGIELDFEDFGGWSYTSYDNFRSFVQKLGTKLHENNKKLMIDGPAIANKTEQGWFAWRYEDFIDLPVDHIVIMVYDYQFDHGTGVPVAPLDWMREVITWASARYPKDKLVVGIPSYGYEGTIGKRPYIRTYDQLKSKSGFATATRDESSGEMTWRNGNQVYFYQDSESIRQKIAVVKELGLSSISVWHLGGNQWY